MNKLSRGASEAVVRRHGWLSQTSSDFQDLWLAKCDFVQVGATQELYKVGGAPVSLYGVADGRLDIYFQDHGIDSSLAYIGGPGFWLGETGAAGGRRVISVTARSKSYLFRMTRAQLMNLGADPALVWQALTMILMRNIATAISVVDVLKRDNPAVRIAVMLANLL